ncbi:MAG: 50S ribosomal protein L18Ae [Candidatus Njordarchaeia archaeon]
MEIKTYRIKAKYRIQRRTLHVTKEVRAPNEEIALDKFFSEIGSHGVKRTALTVYEIKEIPPEEIKNEKLRKLILSDEPVILVE